MTDTVGARASKIFRMVPSSMTAFQARAESEGMTWVIIADPDGKPVGVISRELLTSAGPDAPVEAIAQGQVPFVIVDSQTPVSAAVASPAFEEVHPDSAVLVMSGDAVDGVWAGANLAGAFLSHGVRGPSDFDLPGRIAIANIVVRCSYTEGFETCLDRWSFPERPDVMPECGNPKHLASHLVVW